MKKVLIIFMLISIMLPTITFAEEACCETHAGISTCGSSGYYICNDGTRSTCTCNKEETTTKVTTTKKYIKESNRSFSSYTREDLMCISLALVVGFLLLCITSHSKK